MAHNTNWKTSLDELYAIMRSSGKLDRPVDFDESAQRIADNRNKTLTSEEIKIWAKKIADDLARFTD